MDSHRGGTGGPMRLLLKGKVASNNKGTESSVPVASVRGMSLHHPIIERDMGTRRPVKKKKTGVNKCLNT